jgi:hypothetical protein
VGHLWQQIIHRIVHQFVRKIALVDGPWAVYTYEFEYESAYDLVPKLDWNQILDQFFLKCVYKRLLWVYDREFKP